MAQTIEEILGRKINSVKELKEEIKRLQDSLINLDSESEEYKNTVQQLSAAQGVLNNVTKASVQDNNAAKDSIVGMEKEYKNLYNTYKMFTEEQRNSPMGREMAKSLDELSSKLNNSKKEVGNFKDNIGRYAESAIEAFQKMGLSLGGLEKPLKFASTGMKTFNTILKSNPILAVVAAIVALINVFKKIVDVINKNEESQMRLNKAMATFQPIIDAVKNSFDRLGQAVLVIIEGVAKFVDKLRDAGAAIKDFFKGNKEATKQLQEERALYNEIAEAQNNLTKRKREAEKENAKKSAEVQRLREEASETENLTEKRKLLEEAKRIQGEIDQENLEIAKEENRILEEQAELTANDAAANDALAASTAAVAQAEATAAQNARQFNRELKSTKSSASSAGKSVEDFKKKAKELYKSLQEDNKTEIVKIKEKYEEEKKLLEKYHLDTSLLTKKYNKDIEAANLNARRTYLDNFKKQATIDNQIFAQLLNDYVSLVQASRRSNPVGAIQEELNLAKETLSEFEEIRQKASEIETDILNTFDESAYGGAWEKIDEEIAGIINQPKEKLTGPFLELRNLLDEVNERYGTSITTMTGLRAKLGELKNGINDLKLDKISVTLNETLQDIQNEINDYIYQLNQDPVDVFNMISFEDTDWKSDIRLYGAFLETNVAQEFDILQEKACALQTAIESIFRDENLTTDANGIETYNSLLQQYYDTLTSMIDKIAAFSELGIERTQELRDAWVDFAATVTQSMSSAINTQQQLIQAEVQEGKISKKEADRKIKTLKDLEKAQLAVSIANIAASTAGGLMDIWRGYSSELVLNSQTAAAAGFGGAPAKAALDAKSLASAILRSTGLLTTAVAQISAARGSYISNMSGFNELSAGGGSTSIPATATPSIIDSSVYSYSQERQSLEYEQLMNRPLFVTVTDIENGLKDKVTVTNESSF